MIAAVANCPHPPLLLDGITGRPVAEVEQLRAACVTAIEAMMSAAPTEILIIGGATPAELDKPLSVLVGRLLLARAECPLPVDQLVVPAETPTERCLGMGREAASRNARTGLLVMGDGSARRSVKAPGYLDGRAAPFDAAVERAFAGADPARLAALDADLAAELLVAGRAAWQVLAGAMIARAAGAFTATVHYAADPFGVWYPVVSWVPSIGSMSD